MHNNTFFRYWCYLSLFIIIFIIINSIIGDIYFRMKYSFPKVTSTTTTKLDATLTPKQEDLHNTDYFLYQGETKSHYLKPVAQYSITGYVVALNKNFWLRDFMRTDFDDIALMDIGLTWGELSKPDVIKQHKLKFKSVKTIGNARQLEWDYKSSMSPYYFLNNISHTHLAPKNSNVMGALLKIKKHTIVKLEGYLVDSYTKNYKIISKTSMSRYDRNSTSRGSGACEVLYVTKVQIDNKIYE